MADFSFSAKIRLHQKNKLIIKQNILIETKQSHYLLNVMRKKINDKILIFNQFDGEFLAEIILIKKKTITLFIQSVKFLDVGPKRQFVLKLTFSSLSSSLI